MLEILHGDSTVCIEPRNDLLPTRNPLLLHLTLLTAALLALSCLSWWLCCCLTLLLHELFLPVMCQCFSISLITSDLLPSTNVIILESLLTVVESWNVHVVDLIDEYVDVTFSRALGLAT